MSVNGGKSMEAANDNVDQNKKNQVSTVKFIEIFTREYLNSLPVAQRNQIIKDSMEKDSIAGSLIENELKKFQASNDLYSHIQLGDINMFQIRKKVAQSFMYTQALRERFQKESLIRYNITPAEYENTIKNDIVNKDTQELENILGSTRNFQKYLERILKRKIHPKSSVELFGSLNKSEFINKLEHLPDDEKTEIIIILNKLKNGSIPRDDEIRVIIESPLMSEKEKVNFVHTFHPFISLEQAGVLGLVSSQDISKLRKSYIDGLLQGVQLDNKLKKEIEDNISNIDIKLATRDIIKNGSEVTKFSQNIGFQSFVDNLSSEQQDISEELLKAGPQSYQELVRGLQAINSGNRFENLQEFGTGKIVEIRSQVPGTDEVSIDYIRLGAFDDIKQEFSFSVLGNNVLHLSNPSESQHTSYKDFLGQLQKDKNTSFAVYSENHLNDKIQKGEIKSSELNIVDKASFEGDANRDTRNKVRQGYIQELEQEIEELEKLITVEQDDKQKQVYLKELGQKQKEIEDIRSKEYSPNEAYYMHNRLEFLSKINEIDPEGKKLGVQAKKVAFYTQDEEDKVNTYTVESIDYEDWKINLSSMSGPESLDLTTFYETFKAKKAKRIESVQSPDEYLKKLPKSENLEIKNGKIIQKGISEKSDRVNNSEAHAEYLASTKSKTVVKIIGFNGAFVNIQLGEQEIGIDKKTNKKTQNLKLDKKTQQWSLSELTRFTEQQSLEADWKVGKSYTLYPEDRKNKTKGSPGEKLFRPWSIAEIISGAKTTIDAVKDSWTRGNDVKAAKFALAMGKFLPGELEEDLRAKVEGAESEAMDKELKKLGSVDSWIAVQRIKGWLTNRDTPEYKKEAGLLFMLEKYGHLTSKNALYEYRGKYLWYEAFGGRVNDQFFMEQKESAEKSGQTFSEEMLMLQFLKKQCGGTGYNGIKRRSRLHKEFDGKWKAGINAEVEKGYKDATSYRDVNKMISEGLGEAKGGTTSNAIGWLKRSIEFGGSVEQLSEIPFTLLTSGACYDIDQATYLKINELWGQGQPIVLLRMFGDRGKMDMFQQVWLELCREIQENYPEKYPKIYEDAQTLYNATKNKSEIEKDRIDMASGFWKKYGTPLSRAFSNSLTSDTTHSKIDDIIRRKSETNTTFKKYNDFIKEATTEGKALDEGYMDEWGADEGVAGINIKKATIKYLENNQGGGFKKTGPAEKVFKSIAKDINATPQKIFVGSDLGSKENKAQQEQHIIGILRDFISGLLNLHGGNMTVLGALNNPTSSLGEQLNKWGIYIKNDFYDAGISSDMVYNGDADAYLKKIAQKILSGSAGRGYKTPQVLQTVQNQVANNLNSSPNSYQNTA